MHRTASIPAPTPIYAHTCPVWCTHTSSRPDEHRCIIVDDLRPGGLRVVLVQHDNQPPALQVTGGLDHVDTLDQLHTTGQRLITAATLARGLL